MYVTENSELYIFKTSSPDLRTEGRIDFKSVSNYLGVASLGGEFSESSAVLI